MNAQNRRPNGPGVKLALALRLELSVIVVLTIAAAISGELAYLLV